MITAIIVTGSSSEVANFLNDYSTTSSKSIPSFQIIPNSSISKNPKLLRTSSAFTYNFSNHSFSSKNRSLALNYIKDKNVVKFSEIMNYITSNSDKSPSNASVSKFLHQNNFKRSIEYYSDKTTKIIWKKP